MNIDPVEKPLGGSLCTVAHAVELQAYGVADEQILAIYPTLTREHLRVAAGYTDDFLGICLTLPETTSN
jgi:uncharacterized protein (DUF433 family)